MSGLILGVDTFQVVFVRDLGSTLNGSSYIGWELRLQDNVVVQVLLEVLGTLISSMAIVNSEYLYLGPHIVWELGLLRERLDYVEDNGNSVLVGLTNKTHMCVGGEGPYDSEFLVRRFGILK